MELRAKCVRDLSGADDGERVLVSRLRPRGMSTDQIDAWERGLAPSTKLDYAQWRGWITAREHAALFVAEMWSHAPRLRAIGERAQLHPVTLVCGCTDPVRCRCDLVARLIARLFAAPAHRSAAAR